MDAAEGLTHERCKRMVGHSRRSTYEREKDCRTAVHVERGHVVVCPACRRLLGSTRCRLQASEPAGIVDFDHISNLGLGHKDRLWSASKEDTHGWEDGKSGWSYHGPTGACRRDA